MIDYHLYTADQQAAAERDEPSVALCGFERAAGNASVAAVHIPVDTVPCETCQALVQLALALEPGLPPLGSRN